MPQELREGIEEFKVFINQEDAYAVHIGYKKHVIQNHVTVKPFSEAYADWRLHGYLYHTSLFLPTFIWLIY